MCLGWAVVDPEGPYFRGQPRDGQVVSYAEPAAQLYAPVDDSVDRFGNVCLGDRRLTAAALSLVKRPGALPYQESVCLELDHRVRDPLLS